MTLQAQQASQVQKVLFSRIAALEHVFPSRSAEAVANEMISYQDGFAAGVRYAAPDVLPHLARNLEEQLCTGQGSDASLIVAARLIRSLPELATERSFDCLLSKDRGEDAVTWSALEAWQLTDLGDIAPIARLRASARESSTLRLLASRHNKDDISSINKGDDGHESRQHLLGVNPSGSTELVAHDIERAR